MSHENKVPTNAIERELESNPGAPLSRQVTVTLSSEQYERLFFQPTQPKGDLRQRLANPTLLGLMCFLIPFSETILCLCGFHGTVLPTSLIGLTGDYYFIGLIGMGTAAICEFILGNTLPFAVFMVYGVHWGALAYAQDPSINLLAGFEKEGGAAGAAWAASQGFHNIVMCLISAVFLIASLRINVPFTLIFFGLIGLFAFIAAASFAVPTASTAADLDRITSLLHAAGGFGFISMVFGWYVCLITCCEAAGIPCPLPIFDLSSRVFPKKSGENV